MLDVDALICPDCNHSLKEHCRVGCLHHVTDLEKDFCSCEKTELALFKKFVVTENVHSVIETLRIDFAAKKNKGVIPNPPGEQIFDDGFWCPCGCDGYADHCVYAGTCCDCGKKYYGGNGYGDKESQCGECRKKQGEAHSDPAEGTTDA